MSAAGRVLMVGIDAAEHGLIDALVERGRLPTLARLRRQGAYGLLQSPADRYSGAVWPTFYSGRPPAWHGVYHNKLWDPRRMCCVVPSAHAFEARPFWESLGPTVRTCIVDVPLVLDRANGTSGVYLNGWATHDTAPPHSSPRGLWRRLEREFGRRAMPPENFGPQDTRALAQLLGELLRATEQVQRVTRALLQREPWDLGCIIFGATHRAGHYLWDLDQARDRERAGPERCERLARALEQVYEAVDGALGELLAQADAATHVIVFSLHGMGPNGGWSEIVPEMLAAWRALRAEQPARQGALYRARKRLVGAARPVLKWMPPRLASALVPLWSARMFDWRQTRSFPLPMDLTGLLRVNLKGRERDGIVTPGEDYEAACADLEALFGSLRDGSSGRPIVSGTLRAYAEAPTGAVHREGQPDLIVSFEPLRASAVRELISSRWPAYRCAVPRWLPSGRSGNHLPFGWFIATGPRIRPGAALPTGDILDLAPTVRALLGLEPDPTLHGRPLPLGALA